MTTTTRIACPCEATNEWFASVGLTLEVREKCVGSEHIMSPGLTRAAATAIAKERGLMRFFCPHASIATKARLERRRAGIAAPGLKSTTVEPGALAFFLSIKRP